MELREVVAPQHLVVRGELVGAARFEDLDHSSRSGCLASSVIGVEGRRGDAGVVASGTVSSRLISTDAP